MVAALALLRVFLLFVPRVSLVGLRVLCAEVEPSGGHEVGETCDLLAGLLVLGSHGRLSSWGQLVSFTIPPEGCVLED